VIKPTDIHSPDKEKINYPHSYPQMLIIKYKKSEFDEKKYNYGFFKNPVPLYLD